MRAAILFLAFLSGAAALIYETAWFQMLELVLGSTAVSLGVLLATFMGGTCVGSLYAERWLAGRRAVRVYAVLELAIGLMGVAELWLMPLAGSAYTSWAREGWAGLALRGIVAAVCLLPPTLAMGATLPALARWVGGASGLGALYAANIAGAVAGCLAAGAYLLRLHGVEAATGAAAVLNFAAAGAALWWGRRGAALPTAEEVPAVASPGSTTVLIAVAISGFCALAAEAVWTRLLALLFGASVYTFSLVLAVFLIGLGLGSVCTERLLGGTGPAAARRALAWCQALLVAAIAWTGYALAGSLPYWPVNPTLASAAVYSFQLDFVRTLWALLPPALLWGASFPLALQALPIADPARCMARVYAVNTLGAMAGALAAGVWLVGWVGSQRTEQLLAALAGAAAVLLMPRAFAGVAALAALAWLVIPPVPAVLMAHGRFAATWVGRGETIFAREGRNSSVAVSRFEDGTLTFHVAGKIQASSAARDMRLQRMLGHLTTLVPARPRSVLVIGCGAGVTAGAVAVDPAVERVDIAELEPLVPHAAGRYFAEQNLHVLESSKVHVHIDDGRHYLATSQQSFDAITIDPLDPWVKGAAGFYTREFYQTMRRHLRPGGVVTLYIQLFETNREAVRSAIATFAEVFPNATLWGNPWEGKGHDMVLMGQAEPMRIDLDALEARFPPLAESLAEVGFYSPEDLFATYAGRAADLQPWLAGAEINRDSNLRMQYLAGLGLNRDDAAAIYAELLRYRRYPDGMFVSTEDRDQSIRRALERE